MVFSRRTPDAELFAIDGIQYGHKADPPPYAPDGADADLSETKNQYSQHGAHPLSVFTARLCHYTAQSGLVR